MAGKLSIWRYLAMDLNRAFLSWKFPAGIAGIVLVMCGVSAISLEGWEMDTNVTYVMWLIIYGMPFMISLVFAAFPFAACFCEEFENKFASLQIIRGNLSGYVISKVIVIVLVSAATIVSGMMIYIMLLRLRIPWYDEEMSMCVSALEDGGLRFFVANKLYFLYFLLFCFQYGLMAGCLNLVAAYLSLYVNNKLLVLSTPFMAFYLLSFYGDAATGKWDKLDLVHIFNATYNLWDNDLASFFYAVLICILFMIIFSILIFRKARRKVNHG